MTSKIIKGKTMSASNGGRVRTRLSLLAGSSLVAATIIVSAGGVVLTPGAAWAYDECAPATGTGTLTDGTGGVSDPTLNGSAADTFACAGAFTATGITYSSAGALTVNSTGNMNVGTVGLNLTPNGADSATFTATGTLTGTAGPVIDVTSASGATGPITISAAGVTGTNANVTYGVLAVSNGGAVSVTTTGNVNVTAATAGIAAIRAATTGGNGDVSISASGNVTGRQFAIQGQASGTGALTITSGPSSNIRTDAVVGVAAIDATTGTGLLTINVAGEPTFTIGSSTTLNGARGSVIRANAGGDAVINVARGRVLQVNGADFPFTPGVVNVTAAGQATLNNLGGIGLSNAQTSGDSPAGDANVIAIRAAGGAFTLNNDHVVFGRMDFSSLTGASAINNNEAGIWRTVGVSNFGPGAGEVDNEGIIDLSGDATFNGLETFDNSGEINFGLTRTATGDVLSAPGADFIGSGVNRLNMEVTLGTAGQASCAATVMVADCLDLTGGSTAGLTSLVLTVLGPVTTDANPGIVLVDVSGGEGHDGDVVLDALTPNYSDDPVYGGMIITGGWMGFALQYNEATQQHILSTVVPTQKLEYIAAPQEVLSVWQSTSDTVAGRNADLRERAGGEEGGGAWIRVTGENTKRDVAMAYTAGGAAYQYADAYELDTASVIGGFDALYGEMGGGDFVLGLHGGAVKGSMERASSPTTDEIKGATAGFYTGWWSDGLTLDAVLNLNFLSLVRERPVAEISNTNVISAGVRAEAGWRLPLGEGFYVQPLVTAAYLHADIKEMVETNFTASYEDVDSLRGALGARAGGDLDMGGATLGLWVTGRAWKELAGDAALVVTTPAEAVVIQDDMGGEFQELGAGLSLSSGDGMLEGYVSGGARFGDQIDNYTASAGLRLRW